MVISSLANHGWVPGDPVPLVEDTILVRIGAMGLLVLRTGLPGTESIQYSVYLSLGLSPSGTPGTLEIVGSQPGECIQTDLGRVGIITAGKRRRAPTPGKMVGRGPTRTQIGPGISGELIQEGAVLRRWPAPPSWPWVCRQRDCLMG